MIQKRLVCLCVAMLLAACSPAWAAFPFFETYENDLDTWTPTNNDPYNDETLDGLPPGIGNAGGTQDDWFDVRTGDDGVLEEVPTGFMGVNSPDGSGHFAIMEPISGIFGRPGRQLAYPNRYSWRTAVYADPTVPFQGNNGIPDIWWTNATQGVNPNTGYLVEAGMTITVQPGGNWSFTTTAGGNPSILVPTGNWYNMEMIIENNASASGAGTSAQYPGSKVQVTVKLWNGAKSGMPLYEYTIAPQNVAFAPAGGFDMSNIGGPRYSWWAFPEVALPYLYLDNTGAGRTIGYADLNGDGAVNNLDIQPFEKSLTTGNPAGLTDFIERGDINLDGEFNNLDIQPFEKYLTGNLGPVAAAAVPEPGSIVLFGLGVLALAGMKLRRKAA